MLQPVYSRIQVRETLILVTEEHRIFQAIVTYEQSMLFVYAIPPIAWLMNSRLDLVLTVLLFPDAILLLFNIFRLISDKYKLFSIGY
jgi:hypothetical protein